MVYTKEFKKYLKENGIIGRLDYGDGKTSGSVYVKDDGSYWGTPNDGTVFLIPIKPEDLPDNLGEDEDDGGGLIWID